MALAAGPPVLLPVSPVNLFDIDEGGGAAMAFIHFLGLIFPLIKGKSMNAGWKERLGVNNRA